MRWRSPSPSDLLDPLLPQRLGHPQPTRKRNILLCTFVADSEKEADEERRSLAVSSAITNLASPFPSSILSSLSGTVVWNAVTLALTPSKSRPGSADGEEVGFLRRAIVPPLVRVQSSGWAFTRATRLKLLFICFIAGSVCTFLVMSIF